MIYLGLKSISYNLNNNNLYKMKQDMQKERVSGFKEFIHDVKNGQFPKEEHVISTPNGLIEGFLKTIKN